MKKLFFLLASAVFVMSCSSDDDQIGNDENPQTENVYLKKLTNTSLVNSNGEIETSVIEFEYNSDKKISKLITQSGYTEFQYTDGKLVSYANYSGANENSSGVLVYHNDILTHSIAQDAEYFFRIDYNYSSDGKLIKATQCSGTEPCTSSNTYTEYVYEGANVVKIINSNNFGGSPSTTTYNYTYDDKKNPFSNYSLPTRILMESAFGGALSMNNYIQQTDYANANVIYNNTYNSEGYITIQDGKYDSNGMTYMKNEYEYIEL